MLLFFFFKQKTAYEMRISDWSSDVCSSDLPPTTRRWKYGTVRVSCWSRPATRSSRRDVQRACRTRSRTVLARSEEHTSELQSLMRISYADFCLKQKNTGTRRMDGTQ